MARRKKQAIVDEPVQELQEQPMTLSSKPSYGPSYEQIPDPRPLDNGMRTVELTLEQYNFIHDLVKNAVKKSLRDRLALGVKVFQPELNRELFVSFTDITNFNEAVQTVDKLELIQLPLYDVDNHKFLVSWDAEGAKFFAKLLVERKYIMIQRITQFEANIDKYTKWESLLKIDLEKDFEPIIMHVGK